MECQGETLNSSDILRPCYSGFSWQSVGYTPGEGSPPPCLFRMALGPNVPRFQQTSLLELVVSVNHMALPQSMAWYAIGIAKVMSEEKFLAFWIAQEHVLYFYIEVWVVSAFSILPLGAWNDIASSLLSSSGRGGSSYPTSPGNLIPLCLPQEWATIFEL